VYRTGQTFTGPWATPTGTTFTNASSVVNGTQYCYQVSATNASGASAMSAAVCATPTLPAAATPAVPTAVVATPGNGQVTVNWAANPASNQVTNYNVYRTGQTFTGPWATPTATTFTNGSSVVNGTQYCYQVSATNAAGASAMSAAVCATPTLPAPAMPAMPTAVVATPGNGQVTVNWAANPASNQVTNYNVYRTGQTFTGPWATPTATTFTNGSSVVNGTQYCYQVSATNATGASAESAAVCATPAGAATSPTAPTGNLLLNSSFSCGCISSTMFPFTSFTPGHTSVVADPDGSGQNVLKFAVADSDRPYAGAENPRSDVETAPIFKPGDDDYFAIPMMIPVGTPAVDTNSAFFQMAEVYGQPYGGSPTVSVALSNFGENGVNHFMMNQDATNGYKRAWTGPASNDGLWHTIIFHVNFETNNTGFVQIYFDGKLQTLANGTTTLNETTLDAGINWDGTDGNFLDIQQYRSAGSFPGTVTTYGGAPKIGTTLASVE
jgi:Polysaccharide lyase